MNVKAIRIIRKRNPYPANLLVSVEIVAYEQSAVCAAVFAIGADSMMSVAKMVAYWVAAKEKIENGMVSKSVIRFDS